MIAYKAIVPKSYRTSIIESDIDAAMVQLKRWELNYAREMLIAQSLSTSEGLNMLANAMIQPLIHPMNYSGLGSQLFTVEELPQGAYASYQKS